MSRACLWMTLSAALLLPGGCGLQQRGSAPVTPEAMADDLEPGSLRRAVAESLRFLHEVPGESRLGEWPRAVTAADLRGALAEFLEILDRSVETDASWLDRVAERFDFHPAPARPTGTSVLFTGYYQPVIDASPVRTEEYRYPVYREPGAGGPPPGPPGGPAPGAPPPRPGTEGSAAAYPSRHEIDVLGALDGKGFEIAWLRDPVDRFFLHIQGSGLLRMTDGRELPLNFAASNGRPYTSIGRVLIDEGKVDRESMSMQRIRAWLAEFPKEREALFARNERYIFFRLGEDGPLGSLGVPLTAGRSVATDPAVYPKGALLYVETRTPVVDESGALAGWRPVRRFVVNQDAGAAIRGPGRADLYFGTGAAAGAQAGYMQSEGRLYLLMKRRSAPLG
ncbi:MAG: MltA domain-containing protein [Deltaproteobacteria bacterium]|nr:MltA domain-containing protein [Deltaproteobacteria bacterium]